MKIDLIKVIEKENVITHTVVESLILKGYYNYLPCTIDAREVVESLILKGYYNNINN